MEEYIVDAYYNPTNVGKRIRDERIKANIKLSELSEEMCITEDMLSKIERGLRMCTPDNMFFLCKKFQKSADYFYFGGDVFYDTKANKKVNNEICKIDDVLCELKPKDTEKVYQIIKILFVDK